MRTIIRSRILLLLVTFVFGSPGAFAADPAAGFVVRLFSDACVPNMGQPDRVQAWADNRHLNEITDPVPLQVFVGEGEHGKAWAIPTHYGKFALSIRGTTQACAVWARAADPDEVEADFKRIIDGAKRPGLNIAVLQDETVSSPVGKARSLVYQLSVDGARSGYLFTMLTVERPGGAFQASLRVASANMAR